MKNELLNRLNFLKMSKKLCLSINIVVSEIIKIPVFKKYQLRIHSRKSHLNNENKCRLLPMQDLWTSEAQDTFNTDLS